MISEKPPVLLAGSASSILAQEVGAQLNLPLSPVDIRRFADSETFVKIDENIRGRDVYVIQSTSRPSNENIMELLLFIDAAKRASADRVTAVVPYYGYARQDRKDQGRVALSAKLVANLITTAGADRLITVDLHSGQIQGFFDIPVDHLIAAPTLLDHVTNSDYGEFCVVSPDVGNVKMARNYADTLGVPLAIVDKRRPKPNVSEVMAVIGEMQVRGKNVLLFDDMIDTAGTICNASVALRERGAREVYALAVHGVLSEPALERLEKSPIKEVVITNSIAQENRALPDKVRVLTIAPLIAQAIDRIHNHKSVSALFRQMAR
ncbi:MAG: ribose-phosphate pyrophosphokinase [Candidatus Sumerlaeia bacterium]|nr:ribose-phosphate pyrophosphokinase [Candidatus Sumerlaeia bacterium]